LIGELIDKILQKVTETIDLICFNCKHQNILDVGCRAFPDGIPDEILQSNEHSKPLPGKGNDLVFEFISQEELRARFN